MEDFQIVLLVLGAIAIIAVLVHGFWSIRKQQPKSIKESPMVDFYKDQANKRDPDGFDADGIGAVRVRKANEAAKQASLDADSSQGVIDTPLQQQAGVDPIAVHPVEENETTSHSPGTRSVTRSSTSSNNSSAATSHSQTRPLNHAQLNDTPVSDENTHAPKTLEPTQGVQQGLFAETEDEFSEIDINIIEDEPMAAVTPPDEVSLAATTSATSASTVLAPDQENATIAPENTEETAAAKNEQAAVEQEPQDVLVLHVVAREGEQLQGAELLPCLLSLNFKFGDMDIFHRHIHNAGTGEVLFSLANMIKPGTFDPDNMEQFTTQGIVLFMTLPCYGDPKMNFTIMLNSALQLADDLGAQVLDGQRQLWTEETKLSYFQRIKAVA